MIKQPEPDFKRPDHPDFMFNSELKEIEFTGVRQKALTGSTEFWIMGEMVKEVTKQDLLMNPKAIQAAHVELFGLKPGNE